MERVVILGAGISGLATEYFLKQEFNLEVSGYEKNSYYGGHAFSWKENDAIWDEGPHIFFGKANDVEPFFDLSIDEVQPAKVLNFADGDWIPHPIYVNLFALSEDKKSEMTSSLLGASAQHEKNYLDSIQDYKSWLVGAYGENFSENFPMRYNRKYWRTEPESMSTDWIEQRMFVPTEMEILEGAKGPQPLHYIKTFRYPKYGGYTKYFSKSISNSSFKLNSRITGINLAEKIIQVGEEITDYDSLVNTIPLTSFVELLSNVPSEIQTAARSLECTSLLLVNLQIESIIEPYFHWAYIHDEDLLSTRITNYSNLRIRQAGDKNSFLQVEVYETTKTPFLQSYEEIANEVENELRRIGLIKRGVKVSKTFHYSKHANVIFGHSRIKNLKLIYDYLSEFGLGRDVNEYSPNFMSLTTSNTNHKQDLFLAGRFAQWNYYWTHDCVKRAREVSREIVNQLRVQ